MYFFFFSRTCIEWTNVQLFFFLNGSKTRPGNTAVHPDNLRFWTANQQSAQRKAPVASQPHCSVALEIKTSDSRGCNTPQLRNMWHRRICPQPMTFLRSWRTLRGNCRTQSSRDCTARVYKAHRSIHCENMMETAAGVWRQMARAEEILTICRRGSPDWTSVRD